MTLRNPLTLRGFLIQGSKKIINSLFFTFFLSLAIFLFVKWLGYFSFPYPSIYKAVPLAYPLGAFALYLGVSFLVIPLLYLSIAYLKMGSFSAMHALSPLLSGYLQFLSIVFLFFLLIIYCFLIPSWLRKRIFWGNVQIKKWKSFFKDFGMGALSWLICYPMMLFVNLLIGLITVALWAEKGVEQAAVKNITGMLPYPLLFSLMTFAIVVLVPIVEEILFRGFLQNWLKQYLGRPWTIFIIAFLFALVHFAPSQGKGNLELITSLFVLSCFLSFLYERQTTLWAPLALHMTFNGISMIVLVYSL